METRELATPVLWLAAYLLGFLGVALVLWESLRPSRSRWRQCSSPWEHVLYQLYPESAAFVLAVVLLRPGVETLLQSLQLLPGTDGGNNFSVSLVWSVLTVFSLALYVMRVRAVAHTRAKVEREFAVQEYVATLDDRWGPEWKRRVEALRGLLRKNKEQASRSPAALDDREALEEALAWADRHAYRGLTSRRNGGDVVADMRRMVGKRISGFAFSHDRSYVQVDFADGSCFIVPMGKDVAEGNYLDSAAAASLTSAEPAAAAPDELEGGSREEDPARRASP